MLDNKHGTEATL